MALRESHKYELLKLDISYNGSIVDENLKVECAPRPTLIIGLGGAGLRTVANIKKELSQSVENYRDHICFLGFDTDSSDVPEIINQGMFSPGEVLHLDLNQELPSCFNKPEILTSKNVRQKMRLFFLCPHIRNSISTSIMTAVCSLENSHPHEKIKILIISSLSGSTGSGLILDTAYLIRDTLTSSLGYDANRYSIYSYLYMPDIHNGLNSGDLFNTNAYAALKELDYYFNLDKYNDVYHFPDFFEENKTSSDNVFDHCTVISSRVAEFVDINFLYKSAYKHTARSIVATITSSEFYQMGVMISATDEIFSDDSWKVDNWLNNQANFSLLPENANYKYTIFSHSEINIPFEEAMAYLRYRLFEGAISHYSKPEKQDFIRLEEYIDKSLFGNYINTLFDYAKRGLLQSIPQTKYPDGRAIRNHSPEYYTWINKVIEYFMEWPKKSEAMELIDKGNKRIIDLLKSHLEKLCILNGPEYVYNILNSQGEELGILNYIQFYIRNLEDKLSTARESSLSINGIINYIDHTVDEIPSFLGTIRPIDAEDFLEQTTHFIEKNTLQIQLLEIIIINLKNIFYEVEKIKCFYENHCEVLYIVKNTFRKNAEYVINTMPLYPFAGARIFNIYDSAEKKEILKNFLDSLITDDQISETKEFIDSLITDTEYIKALTEIFGTFNISRDFKNHFIKNLYHKYQNIVEKLYFLAYYNGGFEDLNAFENAFSDATIRSSVYSNSFDRVVTFLKYNCRPFCSTNGIDHTAFTKPDYYIMCPDFLYNDLITFAATLPYHLKVCKKSNSLSIEFVIKQPGFPLAVLENIDFMHNSYTNAISNTVRFLHLDEGEEHPFMNLPDIISS